MVMNSKYIWTCALLAAGVSLSGCDRESKIADEVGDLREAQQNSPKVAADLEQELARAKAEVVRLEEQLALARQGVTNDVIEERKELKNALNEQQKEVKEEITEAQKAAQQHNTESEVAQQELQRTQAKEVVKAQVRTETQVTPIGKEVEIHREQTSIPIETNRVVERTTETPIDQAEIERRRAKQQDRSATAQPEQGPSE
jgi:hypothetical protein